VILYGPATRVFAVAYASDGNSLAVAYEDGSFRVWDLTTSTAVVTRPDAHESHCRSIAWGGDGATLWTTGDEGSIKCWKSKTGDPVGDAIRNEKPYRLVECPAANALAVASRDAGIHLFSLVNAKAEPRRLAGHEGPVRDLSLSADGLRLASVGHDHMLRIWNLKTGECLHTVTGAGDGRLFAVAFDSAGQWVAFAGDGGRIELFDLKAGKSASNWKAHDREIRSLSFSRDGKYLASAGEDVEARIWNAVGGTLLQALPGQKVKAYTVAFSPTENSVAVGRADGRVELWRNVATP
jgi:WD40 repeat protein